MKAKFLEENNNNSTKQLKVHGTAGINHENYRDDGLENNSVYYSIKLWERMIEGHTFTCYAKEIIWELKFYSMDGLEDFYNTENTVSYKLVNESLL